MRSFKLSFNKNEKEYKILNSLDLEKSNFEFDKQNRHPYNLSFTYLPTKNQTTTSSEIYPFYF